MVIQDGDQLYVLHKMDDKSAFALVKRIAALFDIDAKIHLHLAQNVSVAENLIDLKTIKAGDYNIRSFTITGRSAKAEQNIHFHLNRYKDQDPKNPNDLYYDYATLALGPNVGHWISNPDLPIEAARIITKGQFPLKEVSKEKTEATDTLRELIVGQNATHQRMLEDLNKSLTDLGQRRADLEAEAAELERVRREAHEQRERELDEQRAALERQSYMATRRKIGAGIKDVMLASQEVARNTVSRRNAAYAGFTAFMALGVTGIFSAYLTYLTFNNEIFPLSGAYISNIPVEQSTDTTLTEQADAQLTQVSPLPMAGVVSASVGMGGSSVSTTLLWFAIIKMIGSTLLSVFSFVTAANWIRRYLDSETRLAEEKVAFLADVERASWIIEAIHEVKHEANSDLPKEWVDAVTRNLFAPRATPGELDEGAQALRALIGIAGSARVGPQGLEMEFNKKGTKALGEQ